MRSFETVTWRISQYVTPLATMSERFDVVFGWRRLKERNVTLASIRRRRRIFEVRPLALVALDLERPTV